MSLFANRKKYCFASALGSVHDLLVWKKSARFLKIEKVLVHKVHQLVDVFFKQFIDLLNVSEVECCQNSSHCCRSSISRELNSDR